MQVAQVHGVLGDIVAEFIGRAVFKAWLHAATSHPDGEGASVVVAARAGVTKAALAEGRATELRGKDDEGILQHAAGFEVLEECRGWLVNVVTLVGQLARECHVLIPAAVKELHEPYIAFEQAAGQQAISGVGARARDFGAVGIQCRFGFAGDVGQLGYRGLHAEGHLVSLDACDSFGVRNFLGAFSVQGTEVIQQFAPLRTIDGRRILEVEDRIGPGAKSDPLMIGRKEAAAPEAREDGLPGVLARAL